VNPELWDYEWSGQSIMTMSKTELVEALAEAMDMLLSNRETMADILEELDEYDI
jgi:hypothetical protein